MKTSFARHAIVLGLLSAIGPFAIDMYLPALPTISESLHTTVGATQMTLMAFFVGFGICQIIYGPASDMVGRKPPLYFGLAVFMVSAVGCALAPNVEWLIAFRFLQGIGASASMVIPRAVIRDLHTGPDATKLMSMVMLVFSVSPILAPLAGSAVIVPFGWRAVFVIGAGAALLALLLIIFMMGETHPPERRLRSGMRSVAAGYGKLIRDLRFLGLTFIGGLGMSSFFAFLASSSFIYIEHFGLTPTQYSFAFSVNAVGFIGSAQLAGWLAGRFGLPRVIVTAVTCYAALALILLALTLAGVDSLAVLMAMLFFTFACLGLVVPATAVLALDDHGPIAGMASALGGTLQMAAGAAAIVAVSAFFDGTALAMVALIAACATGALVLAWLTLGRARPVRAAPVASGQPAE